LPQLSPFNKNALHSFGRLSKKLQVLARYPNHMKKLLTLVLLGFVFMYYSPAASARVVHAGAHSKHFKHHKHHKRHPHHHHHSRA
jgi:hypothetical protein